MGSIQLGDINLRKDASHNLAGLTAQPHQFHQSAGHSPVRVMVVDDHELIRNGLVTCLSFDENLEIVGLATNGLEAIEEVATSHPNIILMDLVMPGMDGVKTMEEIRRQHPDVRLIVLTAYADGELVRASLQAGASGYLLKGISIDDLIGAIWLVYNGNSVLTDEVTRLLAGMVEPDERYHGRSDMTTRERDVLQLLARGQTNRQIALQLGLSISTIKTHVSNILLKLNASSRAEAVAIYLQQPESKR